MLRVLVCEKELNHCMTVCDYSLKWQRSLSDRLFEKTNKFNPSTVRKQGVT